jgi:glycosyltransferase involved in cell wall biosynthesis
VTDSVRSSESADRHDSAPLPVTLVAHEVGSIGGMERQLAELATGLLGRGHPVTVIARKCQLPPHPRLRWVRVPGPSRPFSLAYPWFFVAGSLLLRLRGRGLVHTTGAIVFNRADLSTVHFCHHGFVRRSPDARRERVSTPLRRLNSRLGMLLSLRAERWCYRPKVTKQLVAVSQGVAHELEEEFPDVADCIAVIPNGVDLDEFRAEPEDREHARRRLGLEATDLIALFVGSEWERKGLRLAIQALSGAPRWQLQVVGDGDEAGYAELARRLGVSDRVRFAPKTPRVAPFYAAADAFVLPTAYETFSLVTFEAAAAGLPLLVTRVSGVEEILRSDVNGWFIERDADAIAARLERLAVDAGLRASMGAAARAAAESFSWSSMVEYYAAHYGRLES